MHSPNRGDCPIDMTVLARLFGDDISSQHDLLRQFVPKAEEDIAEFEAALEQRSAEQVSFFAHRLKSPARTVGANSLADLCLALEIAGRDTDWAEIDRLALDLNPTMKRVKAYIDKL